MEIQSGPKSLFSNDDSFIVDDSVEKLTEYESITKVEHFNEGLTSYSHLTGDFRAEAEKGLTNAFEYIAQNCNPNKYSGMAYNAFNALRGGTPMLNQNCVYCAKAAEKNLAQMENKQFTTFYVTEKVTPGGLGQPILAPNNYECFSAEKETPLSSQLLDKTQPNSRYIIGVPAKGYSGHCMNLVRSSAGTIVIDGQFKVCYNLSTVEGRDKFDKYYGVTDKTDISKSIVEIYKTGAAPEQDGFQDDNEDFEILTALDDEMINDPKPEVGYSAPLQVIPHYFFKG